MNPSCGQLVIFRPQQWEVPLFYAAPLKICSLPTLSCRDCFWLGMWHKQVIVFLLPTPTSLSSLPIKIIRTADDKFHVFPLLLYVLSHTLGSWSWLWFSYVISSSFISHKDPRYKLPEPGTISYTWPSCIWFPAYRISLFHSY